MSAFQHRPISVGKVSEDKEKPRLGRRDGARVSGFAGRSKNAVVIWTPSRIPDTYRHLEEPNAGGFMVAFRFALMTVFLRPPAKV